MQYLRFHSTPWCIIVVVVGVGAVVSSIFIFLLFLCKQLFIVREGTIRLPYSFIFLSTKFNIIASILLVSGSSSESSAICSLNKLVNDEPTFSTMEAN